MTAPIQDAITDPTCVSCKKDISKQKPVIYCDFCGHRACDKCMHKSRQFKQAYGRKKAVYHSVAHNTMPQNKGRICKLCDNKFMMMNTYKEFSESIEQ